MEPGRRDRQGGWGGAGVGGKEGQQAGRGVEGEGLEAVLMGPVGPFAPGRQPLEHRPGGRQIGGGEIGLGAGGGQGEKAGDHHGAGQHQRPGEGGAGMKGRGCIAGSRGTCLNRQRNRGE